MGDHTWGQPFPSHTVKSRPRRGREELNVLWLVSEGQGRQWSPQLVIPQVPVLAAVSTVFLKTRRKTHHGPQTKVFKPGSIEMFLGFVYIWLKFHFNVALKH